MFEEILYAHLIECEDLTKSLTTYNGEPAIFNQTAPDDMDDLWGGTQYGRVIFFANMQADAERQISGTLGIDLQVEDATNIERLAQTIQNEVDSHFFTSETQSIYVKWSSTRYYDVQEKKLTVASLVFSLIAFPNQLTSEPDPIRLMNKWVRSIMPNVKLIGYDTDLPSVWKVTEDMPAIYWRTAQVYPCKRIPSMYAGDWYTAQMYAHILTTDISVANALAKFMCQALNQKKVLRFDDDTCMRIDNNNQVQPGADELRIGQLSVEGDYCILRIEPDTELLKNIVITEKGLE